MKGPVKRILFWMPRILSILFAVFTSIFALDIFGEGYGTWQTIVALLMHLIPTAFVIVVLIISWRWEWIGACLFAAAGLYYAFTTLKHPDWILVISGPLFVIAILYLLNWLNHKKLRASS